MTASAGGLAGCRACPRLAAYLERLPPARGRRRSDYHNRPVGGFGDPGARILLLGLAPGAHGANRTGRPFTGDGAGTFMYPLLHRAGLADRVAGEDAGDGLVLRDLFITNAVKCAPPGNRPLPDEFRRCRPFLEAELEALPRLRVVLALGREAFCAYLRLLRERGAVERLADHPFAHGALHRPDGRTWLLASYHTSRYNVQTGRLTDPMFLEILERARRLAGGENG